MANGSRKVPEGSADQELTGIDPRVPSNLGRRIKDKAELERAVIERCEVEFAERWPHDDPATARRLFASFIWHDHVTHQAAIRLARLRVCLIECLELQPDLHFGGAGDMDGHEVPNPVAELEMLRTGLTQLEEGWLKIRERWSHLRPNRVARPVGLQDQHWLDWAHSEITPRQAVYLQYSQALAPTGKPITDRNLAVVSLLVGNRKMEPGRRGSTVSEVIIQETKAMKKLMEAHNDGPLRRQCRQEF